MQPPSRSLPCNRGAALTGSPVPARCNQRVHRRASTALAAQTQRPQGRIDPQPAAQSPFMQPRPPPAPFPPPPAQQQQGYYQPPPPTSQKPQQELGSYANALIAAAFVAGLGLGVYFDSEVTLSPNNVSSTEIIDRSTPNADICMANGYSASVFDMKLYVTFNPFNVYTTQPVIKSGCVLRRANVGMLEREQLVTPHEVDLCKSRMNTFAYMGDLKNSPEVACVYHSEEAENQYLTNLRKNGGMGAMIDSMSGTPAAAEVK
ncbi:hypothetical protein QJQ45_025581 [Haematococcus lacustris]|nr:hypothetical protein QJQ45_025581 [Haematococcus lacustris]